MDLSHLNPDQREAVLCTDGPLLVLAGAGSGKTRVITHRIQYLLEQGIPADAIVSVTFTNKAAKEMRERLSGMVGKKLASQVVLGTFHSLGVRMMRENPEAFGLPKRFTILDQGDVYGIVRGLLREYGVHGGQGDRRFDLGAIVQRISLWKNEFCDAEDAQAKAKAPHATEYDEIAALLYQPYEDRLRALGAVDFDDLVCRIALSLKENPELRASYTRRWAYVMVDEYQDTNGAQFQMLRMLLSETENLCVVGDDDQAIYGWRGAKVANILGFDMVFRNAKVIRLQANYRSRPPVLDCANALIQHNQSRHDKKLIPAKEAGMPVDLVVCPDDEQESKWVAAQIRKLVVEDRVPANEVAVLYRSSRLSRPIEQLLQEHGIPYRVLGGQAFYDKKDVKDAMAYLKLIVAPWDDIAVRRAIDTPSRGIGRSTMEKLAAHARKHEMRLIDAVHRHTEVEGIAPAPARALTGFSGMIRAAQGQARSTRSVMGSFRGLLEQVRLRDNVLKETGSADATEARWGGVQWLMESVERFETKSKEQGKGSWSEYLGTLALDRNDDGEAEEIQGQVSLATMHSSKGLEWDHVFIVGCEEGILPHKRVEAARISDAIEGDIEEERRLFYVGITRAREVLRITRAAARIVRGREVPVVPSRFIEELSGAGDSLREYDVTKEERLTADDLESMADAFLSKLANGT